MVVREPKISHYPLLQGIGSKGENSSDKGLLSRRCQLCSYWWCALCLHRRRRDHAWNACRLDGRSYSIAIVCYCCSCQLLSITSQVGRRLHGHHQQGWIRRFTAMQQERLHECAPSYVRTKVCESRTWWISHILSGLAEVGRWYT